MMKPLEAIEELPAIEFMAHIVGLQVLHPGGLKTTDTLARLCQITEHSHVLDIGCGKGTSAIHLAKKFGCKVTGIDASERRIEEAIHLAEREGAADNVSFRIGNVEGLPFPEGSFDAAITQAALVYMEPPAVIKEAVRVLRKGGYFGIAELTWKKEPTPGFIEETIRVLQEPCVVKAQTQEGWRNLLEECGLKNIRYVPVEMWRPKHVLLEKRLSVMKIAFRLATNSRARRRFFSIGKHFRKNDDIFGFGIHVGQRL